MASVFQPNVFQNNVFQTIAATPGVQTVADTDILRHTTKKKPPPKRGPKVKQEARR